MNLLRKLPGYCLFSVVLALSTGCGGGGSAPNVGGGGGGGGGGGSNAPQIKQLEPSRTMVGVPLGSIIIHGANFTHNSSVLFDGVAAPTFFHQSDTIEVQIQVTVSTVAQLHSVQVSDATGKSNIATYEVYASQPGPTPFSGQPSQYMGETLPQTPLVPDLNGDGRADLVMVVPGSGSTPPQLVIRDGQADGTFSAPHPAGSFTLQAFPNVILAGDFNQDGHTDLVLLSESGSAQPGSYQVLINDGTGRFNSAAVGALPPGLAPAAIGDFNHDGKLDFVFAASNGPQPFSLFLGRGDGSFNAPVTMGAAGAIVPFMTAIDLNNDGYTDLVYINRFIGGGDQVRILLSSPDGSFTDSAPAGLPSPVYSLVVADFNHDRIPDIFAIDARGIGQAYLGAGNGTFTAGSQVLANDNYLSRPPLVAGDFDNDGNVDIATRTTLAGPDEVLFLWGDGQGNFTRQVVVSDHSFFLQTGDVNGDGIPDIFSWGDAGFAYPSVILGRRDRNIPSAQVLYPRDYGTLSAGNVLGDGFTDLLVGGAGAFGPSPGVPGTMFHAQPDGSFLIIGSAPSNSTVLIDLNGDGIADMVGLSGTNLLIWKGDGTGQFGAPITTIPVTTVSSLDLVFFRDMDRDGFVDIVIPGGILYGKGNFQFDAVTIPFFENFAVGDFDGDGIPDIATPSGVMFGQGNRSFTAPTGSTPLPTNALPYPTQKVADMNGDGKDDIVIAPGTAGPYISIYLSQGRSGFMQDQSLIVNGYGVTITSLALADFNGDGHVDIAAGMLGGADDVVLFTNDGTGKYQVTSYAVGVNAVFSVAADFNHDGKPDLALLNYGFSFKPPTVTVLLHQ